MSNNQEENSKLKNQVSNNDKLKNSEKYESHNVNVHSLYNKIESIKSSISIANADRPELWIQRQNLQDLYHQIILNDIDFTIDKKLEQELWNFVFKNLINYFQSQIKENSSANSNSSSTPSSIVSSSLSNKNKNLIAQKKIEAQANLSFFLEAARGFYTKLLEDLVHKYGINENKKNTLSINVSFYQRFPSIFDKINNNFNESEAETTTKEKQILYICQHTFTHLGDIARYGNQFNEAKNYYLHAIKLVPHLGHPYNQLGILFETSRNNQLSTVFYYMRSIAAKFTFPLASTNLENFFNKLIDTPITRYNPSFNLNDSNKPIKLAQKDLLGLFLQLNAIIYSCLLGKSKSANAKLQSFLDLFKSSFILFLPNITQADKLDSSQFCQIVSIVLFHITNPINPIVKQDSKLIEIYNFAFNIALDLFIFFVEQFTNAYNQAVDKNNQFLCDLILPSLYLSFNFIEHFKDAYLIRDNKLWTQSKDENVKTLLSIQSTAKFLNCLNQNLKIERENKKFNTELYSDYPLNEDRMMDNFLPFREVQNGFNFKNYLKNNQILDDFSENLIRVHRILNCFERILNKSDPNLCYLKMNPETEIKFDLNHNCKAKLQTLNVSDEINEEKSTKSESTKQQSQIQQDQPARRRRQNVAIASLTNEIQSIQPNTKENLLLNRPVMQNSQVRFQNFSASNLTLNHNTQNLNTFPSQHRFPSNQWQQNDFVQQKQPQQAQGAFFPSASTRQFQQSTQTQAFNLNRNLNNSSLMNENLIRPNILNNGFPSFLPNTNPASLTDQKNNFQFQQMNNQYQPQNIQNQLKFQRENINFHPNQNNNEIQNFSNELVQQLLINSNKNDSINQEKSIEYNLNMINYMQLSSNQANSMNSDFDSLTNNNCMNSNKSSLWSYQTSQDNK